MTTIRTPAWIGATNGVPAPQGSKSVSKKTGRMFEANKRTMPWRKMMIESFTAKGLETPLDEPLEVHAVFNMPKPKRPKFRLWPATKPDYDKLARNMNDALTLAGIIQDDSRIVKAFNEKRYAPTPEQVGVLVQIYRLCDTEGESS